jgi:glycosyltransferase involved in cell wall biosynthesis
LYAPSRTVDRTTDEHSALVLEAIEHSLIIPVYRNEANVPDLLEAVKHLSEQIRGFEVVFVVDGSPDASAQALANGLAQASYAWQLIELSRNFGSFAAIRQGLAIASGRYFAVMAADLQEPPQLIEDFFNFLDKEDIDLVVGVRGSRSDPLIRKFLSQSYWRLYRATVMREIPSGGVDVFGCNKRFLDALLSLEERNSFLIGQLFWLGFRRREVLYERRARVIGKSAWSFRRRLRYMLDNVFAFSDLPINILLWLGTLGTAVATISTFVLITAWVFGLIQVRGYVPIMLTLMFFGSLLVLGQGIIGGYVWRVAENTKKRPLSVVLSHRRGGVLGSRPDAVAPIQSSIGSSSRSQI